MYTETDNILLAAVPIVIASLADALNGRMTDPRTLRAAEPVLTFLAKHDELTSYHQRMSELAPLAVVVVEAAIRDGKKGGLRVTTGNLETFEALAARAVMSYLAHRPDPQLNARLFDLAPRAADLINTVVVRGLAAPELDSAESLAVLTWYAAGNVPYWQTGKPAPTPTRHRETPPPEPVVVHIPPKKQIIDPLNGSADQVRAE
jgi:hypothetical protein